MPVNLTTCLLYESLHLGSAHLHKTIENTKVHNQRELLGLHKRYLKLGFPDIRYLEHYIAELLCRRKVVTRE
jgi:hypothetical protein